MFKPVGLPKILIIMAYLLFPWLTTKYCGKYVLSCLFVQCPYGIIKKIISLNSTSLDVEMPFCLIGTSIYTAMSWPIYVPINDNSLVLQQCKTSMYEIVCSYAQQLYGTVYFRNLLFGGFECDVGLCALFIWYLSYVVARQKSWPIPHMCWRHLDSS